MKQPNEIITFLEGNIPRDEIATRSGGGSKTLSYLETWKVIDLLNNAFGNLGWDSETTEMKELPQGKNPSYIAKVRITAMVRLSENSFIKVIKEGYGWGSDKSALNAHEMAVKEAESDAFKRAAMKYGKRLGLALYDKTQEYVSDEREVVIVEPKPSEKPGIIASFDAAKTIKITPLAPKEPQFVVQDKSKEALVDRGAINRLARSTSKVLIDKKVMSESDMIALVQSYGVKFVEELSDDAVNAVLTKLQTMVKGGK